MSENEAPKYRVWLSDDAEHPGDQVEEEFVCEGWDDLKFGVMTILAGLEDKPHRAGILITMDGRPLKDEVS